jgi:hypothetical protein
MTKTTRSQSLALLIVTAVLLFPQATAFSQDASSQAPRRLTAGDNSQTITDADIQMMRTDIRSQRKQIIAANMKLTDAEAEKFWPLYDQYVSELVKNNGVKYQLIRQYVETGGALTDAEADSAVKQWVAVGGCRSFGRGLEDEVHPDLPQSSVGQKHGALLPIGSTGSAND